MASERATSNAKATSRRATQTRISSCHWHEARPAPIVLVSGPENFLAERAVTIVRETLRAQNDQLEQHHIDASSYTAGQLFTLASPSLFAEPRMIFVDTVETCSDAFLTDAITYTQAPADDTTLILRHAGGQRGKALLDVVRTSQGKAVEVTCEQVTKDQHRLAFTQAEFHRLRAKITPAALRMLVTAYATDLGELAGACAQLVSDNGAHISEDEVARLTEGRVEANGFTVADAAIAGRAAEALVLLRQALSTGAHPVALLAALNLKIRTMARVYGATGDSRQLAKELGIAFWQVERAQRSLRGWSEQNLARCIDLAAETECKLKGGSRDPEYALERYLLFIAKRGR